MFKKIGPLVPFLLILCFVLIRLKLHYNHFLGREVYFYSDEAIYAILGQRFLNGDFFNAFHPYWNSGFSILTIPLYLFSRSWESAQYLISAISSIALIFIMYFTLKKISLTLAILTAFITAFSQSLAKLTYFWGTTEPLYISLLWLAVFFGYQSFQTKKIKYYAITGFFFGLAYFIRTEAIYTFGFFLILSFLSLVFKKRKKILIKNKLTILSILLGIFSYFYFPISNLGKFIIFRFLIFKSTRGFFFALIFFLISLIGIFFERKSQKLLLLLKGAFLRIGLASVLFLIINLPYISIISVQLGKLTLSGKYAYIRSAHPFTPEQDRLTTWAQEIWSIDYPNYHSPYYDSTQILPAIWKNLDTSLESFLKRVDYNLNFFAFDNIFSNYETAFIVIGFLALIFQKNFRQFVLFLTTLLLGSFLAISYFMDSAYRYFAFSFPVLYIMQAGTVFALSRLFSKIRSSFFYLTILIFIIVFFQKNIDLKSLNTVEKTGRYVDQKIIGEWLKSQDIKLVMARTEGISFYSGVKMVYMPAANPQTIIKFAKAWGVEYIIARPVESSWDYMRPIVNPNFNHPDLVLKHQFKDGTLIWKVRLTEEEQLYNFRTNQDVNKRFDNINIDSQIRI